MITRRGLLGGVLAAMSAPALVRASSLMKTKVWVPPLYTSVLEPYEYQNTLREWVFYEEVGSVVANPNTDFWKWSPEASAHGEKVAKLMGVTL